MKAFGAAAFLKIVVTNLYNNKFSFYFMAGKDDYEYVLVKDHPILLSDLKATSDDLQKNINAAYEASNLHAQKHEEVQKAISAAHELMGEISKIKRTLPIRELRKPSMPKYRPATQTAAPAPAIVDEDFLERSQKALQNLNRNIAELKLELGRIK